MRQNARAQWYSSKNVRKWWLESCTEFSSSVFSHCILDLIHKTFRFTHQWSPTGNVFTVSHIMKPLRWRSHSRPENKYHRETFGWFSQMNFLFFLFFLSFFLFFFFWKTVWVMLMSMCWYTILTMIVSGVLDWCYRQARSHHINHHAFN